MESNIMIENGASNVLYHEELERGVLGAMLSSQDMVLLAVESLKPEDFYVPAHREIFDAMQMMAANSRAIDPNTLDEELTRRGRLDAVGGASYLITLRRKGVLGSVNMPEYIKKIEEKSALRQLIATCQKIVQNCNAGDMTPQEVLEDAEKSVFDIAMRKGGKELVHIQDVLMETFEHIELLAKNNGKLDSVESGYADLDELLTGFHPGEMILVAGRPAMGKTSIGMNFIENAAIRTGTRAAVFSLEMPAEQLAMRMLCTEARVNMQNVRRGQISNEEWDKLCNAIITICKSAIYVDASPGLTVSQIRSKARRMQSQGGLDIIMIDYLSLMSGVGKFGSRQEEVAQISRALKSLAVELHVPIIALQQLSRAPTGRSNHRPQLSDIRESGAIEQDADVVMFIHREDYYEPDTAEKNIAELIIAKQRNGSLGTVKLGWKGEYTWFMDLSPQAREAR